jgi:hypothetical protein
MRMYFVVTLSVAVGAASSAYASVLTQTQAVRIAKAATKKECSRSLPCTYDARRKGTRWYVFVEFTRRNSPSEPPYAYPGGHEIVVVDDQGKIVEVMPGQ